MPETLAKPLSINAKCPFPVDVGRSKMPSLKVARLDFFVRIPPKFEH